MSIPYPLSRSHSILYDFRLRLEACCICLCPWSTSYFSFIAHSEFPSHNSNLLRLANLVSRPFHCRYSVGKLSGETLDLRLLFFSFNCRSAVFFLDGSIFVLASLPRSRLTELSASVQHLARFDILRASSFRQSFLISIFYTASLGSEFHEQVGARILPLLGRAVSPQPRR